MDLGALPGTLYFYNTIIIQFNVFEKRIPEETYNQMQIRIAQRQRDHRDSRGVEIPPESVIKDVKPSLNWLREQCAEYSPESDELTDPSNSYSRT